MRVSIQTVTDYNEIMLINKDLPEGTSQITELEIKLKLKELLALRPWKQIRDNDRRASAVLIPIFYSNDQYHILFTKRTELVHHHKGEISFPGGGFHVDDGSLVQTALRESQEEIGLDPLDVEVLGELDDIITRGSPYIISPFIGSFKPDYHFATSAFEIAEIIIIPISALLNKEHCEAGPEIMPDGQTLTAYTFSYDKYRITGATARILNQFLSIYCAADCTVRG
jgi:8-oxo-dGTP pyrophosphatase MutT (NUDIX family)